MKFDLPEKLPYEGKATLRQKNYLWKLGIKDQASLDALGKEQASWLIDAVKAKSQVNGCVLKIVFIAVGIVAIIYFLSRCGRGDTQEETNTPVRVPAVQAAPRAAIPAAAPRIAPAFIEPNLSGAEVSNSKRLALKEYPELGDASSAFNHEFVARFNRYRTENPAFFYNAKWPQVLADEVAGKVGDVPKGR